MSIVQVLPPALPGEIGRLVRDLPAASPSSKLHAVQITTGTAAAPKRTAVTTKLTQTQILEKLGWTPAQIKTKTAQGWDALTMRTANTEATLKGLPQPFTTSPTSAVVQDLLPIAGIIGVGGAGAAADATAASGAATEGVAGGSAATTAATTAATKTASSTASSLLGKTAITAGVAALIAAYGVRLLEVLGGGALVIMGLVILARSHPRQGT